MKGNTSTIRKIPQFVILTVVITTKNRFALQGYELDTPINCNTLSINLDGYPIAVNALTVYKRHGRLSSPAINDWIHKYRLINYDEPVKLIFRLVRDGTKHHYSIYGYQGNFISNPLI
jgi:hypothetical protein